MSVDSGCEATEMTETAEDDWMKRFDEHNAAVQRDHAIRMERHKAIMRARAIAEELRIARFPRWLRPGWVRFIGGFFRWCGLVLFVNLVAGLALVALIVSYELLVLLFRAI